MFSLCVILFFAIPGVSSEVEIACNRNNNLSPEKNLSESISVPTGWNTSLSPPTYLSNQDCRWDVQVPQGYYAYVIINSQIVTPSTLKVVYQNGVNEDVPQSGHAEPYFMIAPSFSIILSVSNSTVNLGFVITYAKMPEVQMEQYNLSSSANPVVLANLNSTLFTSSDRVSLIAADTQWADFASFLRCFIVFDGPDTNSTLIGNLRQLVDSYNQFVSTNSHMRIVNLFAGVDLGTMIVAQSYSNVKNFNQYRLTSCRSTSCNVQLVAHEGTSAVVTISNNDRYLTGCSLAENSKLKIYYGNIKDENIVYTYNSNSSGIPQKLNNYITTFALDSGSSLLKISSFSQSVDWNLSYDKRQGFISSPKFNELSTNQDVTETFDGNDYYNYTTKVINHGIIGKATLQITTYDSSNKVVDDKIYSTGKLPSSDTTIQPGKSFSIIYKSNGENTTGVLVDFSISTTESSAMTCFVWLSFVITLLHI
ncbi:unnamed protein product [Caenorhabditis angaria]|uniref:CUB-like domain-containing protein n=1 Tax=Caenorhabditis angaria TaxID=860376 RepID=A0A9P1N357_9PELO|nr:unnamed protein product [Caenorhabditis angaria]